MNHKDIVKYFYEVIVSENMLDELPEYIAEDCVQRIGEKEIGVEKNVSRLYHKDCPPICGRKLYYFGICYEGDA